MNQNRSTSKGNENNQRFRDLFEHIAIGLVICDTNGLFINVNNPFCDLTGYSREELMKMTFQDITHPDDLLLDLEKAKQALAGKIDNYSVEKRYIRKDKKVISVNLTVSLIRDENGQPKLFFGTIEDITLRKQTEEELDQSKKDWKHIFQAISHPTILLDNNHKVIDTNDAVIKFSGKTREELIGTPCYQIFHGTKKLCPPSGCPMDTLLKSGKIETVEMEMEAFNGTFIVSCTPIADKDGKLKNIIHIATDITYLKKVEQSLHESETRYRILLDTSPVGIAVHSEGKIVFANNTGCKMLGANTTDELVGKKINEIIHPDTWLESKERIQRLMAGETGLYPAEDKYIRLDGKVIDVQVFASLIKFDGKDCTQVIVMDITESKKAKENINELERRFTNIMNSVNLVSLVLDKNAGIVFCNEYLQKLTGYTHDELIGKNWFEIFIPSDNLEEIQSIFTNSTTNNALLAHHENEIVARDGSKILISWNNTILKGLNGEVLGSASIGENITKRKKAEKALINKNLEFQTLNEEYQVLNTELTKSLEHLQNMNSELEKAKEKAEESDHLKTAFLHNISHEIRTPMNAIVGFSEFLKQHNLPLEKRIHFSDIIVQSSYQLLSIISDIISIATIEAGQEKITEKEINLNSMLKLLHEQFTLKADKQNDQLILKNLLPESDALLISDETKLIQVLTNLIANAIKFTQHGYVNYGCEIKDSELEFFVEDTGIGIPDEMHQEIFKRFRQVESTTARQFGGSGLGLSISKAYIELLGGSMWIKSELGKGSTFYFTVPYKRVQKEKESVKHTANSLLSIDETITILVAEDEDYNFMLIKELLSDLKADIIRAANGVEAVNICKTRTINLVLMDIKMPLMDGMEATKQIREFLPNLPIIAQTAYSTDYEKSKILASGCSDFISKPIKQELLISKIKGCIYK